jgi:putative transposase
MPNGEQLGNLRQFAGSCRFVYNKALALNLERYEKKEQRLGYAELCALLPHWKLEHPFLSDVPAQALQQALKNLERAYANFYQKRAGFPKFKKKGQPQSFRVPQGFEVDNQNGCIKLPKLGWMRYRKSRDILGEPKRHRQRVLRQVVRLSPNGTRSRNAAASAHVSRRVGLGHRQIGNPVQR